MENSFIDLGYSDYISYFMVKGFAPRFLLACKQVSEHLGTWPSLMETPKKFTWRPNVGGRLPRVLQFRKI